MEAQLKDHGLEAIEILQALDSAPVECDGFANLARVALAYAGFEHDVLFGALDTGRGTLPHLCIRLDDVIYDYRARMWIGEDAPHGEVCEQYKHLYKDFHPHNMQEPSTTLFFILYDDPIEVFFDKLMAAKHV